MQICGIRHYKQGWIVIKVVEVGCVFFLLWEINMLLLYHTQRSTLWCMRREVAEFQFEEIRYVTVTKLRNHSQEATIQALCVIVEEDERKF